MRRKRRDRRPVVRSQQSRPVWASKSAKLALMGAAMWSMVTMSEAVDASGTPAVTGYAVSTPAGGPDTLTVSGSNFGTSGTVDLNNQNLTVVSWSDSSVTVDLPANAEPGPLEVNSGGAVSSAFPFRGWNNGSYSVSSAGQVTTHGNAQFYGDLKTAGISTSSPIIQIVVTPDGKGYWLLAASGQIYPFGDATFSASPLASGVTAKQLVVLPTGTGGYILTSTNQVVAVGSGATVFGQAPSGTAIVSMAVTPAGTGYWLLENSGQVLSFGAAPPWTSQSPPGSYTINPPTVANGSFVRVNNTAPVYWYNNGVLYHVPDAQVFFALGGQWSNVQSLWELPAGTLGPPMVVPYPDGSVIRPGGGSAVYFVSNGVLNHIASSQVFFDMGLSWNEVQVTPSIQPNWPVGPAISSIGQVSWPNGMLVRVTGTNPVYLIENGTLRWVASSSVFLGMGFQWSQVLGLSHLPSLPKGTDVTSPAGNLYATGTLVRQSNTNPVYAIQGGVRSWIPTESLFNSLGFSFSRVLSVSSLSDIPQGPNINEVVGGQNPGTAQSITPTPIAIVPNENGTGGWVVWNSGVIQADNGAPTLPQPNLNGTLATDVVATPNDRGLLFVSQSGAVIPVGTVQTWGTPSGGPIAFSPEAAPDEVSAGFGYFWSGASSSASSYQDMLNYGSQMSIIQPAWFNLAQNSNYTWQVTGWPSSSNISTVVNAAHKQQILVLPSIGQYYVPSSSLSSTNTDPMAGSAAQVSAFINQIVSLTQTYNLDGITIDFENNGTGSLGQSGASNQYTSFIQQLGQALHAAGKRLVISVYAAPSQDGTIYNTAALQNYVDWLDVMTYEEHNSSTPPGPTTGIGWQEYWIGQQTSAGVAPGKILMGLAPYGYSWSMSPTSGVTGVSGTNPNTNYSTDRSIEQMVAQDNIKTYWDPNQAEMFFTTGTQATAPTGTTYTTNNVNQYSPAVQDLQSLVNIVNDIHAINSNTPLGNWPIYLWADGYYGSYTQQAVEEFQSWAVPSQVGTSAYGTYNAATATALQNFINQYNVGSKIWWDDTPQSIQARLNFAIADHLGGIDAWRYPFESTQYFNVLARTSAVNKY